MTREEAIHELGEWLEQMIQHGVPSHSAKRKALATAIALLSAETHDKRTETHGVCSDLISRADAIEVLAQVVFDEPPYLDSESLCREFAEDKINAIPSAELTLQTPQTYGKSINPSNAEVVSADAEWIPCSERLPKAEDMYQPPEQRYLCQLEAHGERKFCVLSRLKGAVSPFWDWYGIAVYDSDVIAWMPLPKPYREGEEE